MATKKTWAQAQLKTIMDGAKAEYGNGWAKLSDEQRDNYLMSRVLYLILGQAGEQFKPAQELAREIIAEINKATDPLDDAIDKAGGRFTI